MLSSDEEETIRARRRKAYDVRYHILVDSDYKINVVPFPKSKSTMEDFANREWGRWTFDWVPFSLRSREHTVQGELEVNREVNWSRGKQLSAVYWSESLYFMVGAHVMNVFDIIKEYGISWLGHQAQVWFSMLHGGYLSYEMELSSNVQLPDVTLYWRVEVKGPYESDWSMRKGLATDRQDFELRHGQMIDRYMYSKEGDVVQEPDRVHDVYLHHTNQVTDYSYNDHRYYDQAAQAYGASTLLVHRKLVQPFLQGLDQDTLVIAPADGLGMIATEWLGPVIAGDRVLVRMTSERVRQEDITATLRRGQSENALKKVVILSFCSCFLTEQDKQLLKEMNVQTLVIDAHPTPLPLDGMFVLGPNMILYRGSERPPIIKKETVLLKETPLYSDNLSRNRVVTIASDNVAVTYLMMMQPGSTFYVMTPAMVDYYKALGRSVTLLEGEIRGVIPLSSIREVLALDPEKRQYVFFAPIGRPWTTPQKAMIGPDRINYSYVSRTVYRASASDYTKKVLSGMTVELVGPDIYFYVSSAKEYVLKYDVNTPMVRARGTVKFREMKYEGYHVRITFELFQVSYEAETLCLHRDFPSNHRDQIVQFYVWDIPGSFSHQYRAWYGFNQEVEQLFGNTKVATKSVKKKLVKKAR